MRMAGLKQKKSEDLPNSKGGGDTVVKMAETEMSGEAVKTDVMKIE